MPLYEFKCSGCGNVFEFLARSSTDAPEKCPKCGAEKPAKQFSAFAIKTSPDQGNVPVCNNCPRGPCPYGRQ
jgi:putative FmdB family regulatory protein